MLNKASSNRVAKALTVFTHAAVRPGWTVRALGRLYNDICVGRATIPTISIGRLLPPDGRITLLDVVGEDGNMSTEEVVALSGLVRATSPHTILEIGTFNGNTTLQLAANSPETCTVYTLDLPVGSEADPRTEANDMPRHHRRCGWACTTAPTTGPAGSRPSTPRTTAIAG